ncbi:hypothetical protein [Acinetobacter sp. ANC 5502]
MKIETLRPHVCSKLAHDLGLEFLEQIEITVKNALLETDLFFDTTFSDSKLSEQAVAKVQPDLLMDKLKLAAETSGHIATLEDTKPRGHTFVQVKTNSCVIVSMQKFSTNTTRAQYYADRSLKNLALLIDDPQPDLFSEIKGNIEINESHIFICMTSYWDKKVELIDLSFDVPHPSKQTVLMRFSLDELKESVMQSMTDIAEEPSLVTLLKSLDEDDNITLDSES